MKTVAVFGTGVVGQHLASKLAALGYTVRMGTRDVTATLAKSTPDAYGNPPVAEWLKAYPQVQLVAYSEVAVDADLLINATSGGATLAALQAAGADALRGKVMIDIANPLDFSNGMPPSLSVCNTVSLGEQVQAAFPDTLVVKTLNTLNAYLMTNPALLKGPHHIFVSSNHAEAKTQVRALLVEMGWPQESILDFGDITFARATEMLLPIWIRLYMTKGTPMFNFYINDQSA